MLLLLQFFFFLSSVFSHETEYLKVIKYTGVGCKGNVTMMGYTELDHCTPTKTLVSGLVMNIVVRYYIEESTIKLDAYYTMGPCRERETPEKFKVLAIDGSCFEDFYRYYKTELSDLEKINKPDFGVYAEIGPDELCEEPPFRFELHKAWVGYCTEEEQDRCETRTDKSQQTWSLNIECFEERKEFIVKERGLIETIKTVLLIGGILVVLCCGICCVVVALVIFYVWKKKKGYKKPVTKVGEETDASESESESDSSAMTSETTTESETATESDSLLPSGTETSGVYDSESGKSESESDPSDYL